MFDERKAQRVVKFIECLKHTKGDFHGKPFKLLDWQKEIIEKAFGTVQDDDPTKRQYSTVYVEIPKKQGKSELGAAIALNQLVNDDEWKAEVYSCAADRQQASIVFDVAADMVDQSPILKKKIKVIPSTHRMVYLPTGSLYQVLSAEVACVTEDTVVQMEDGTIKTADQVKAGDVLLSYNGIAPVFDEVVSVEVQKPSPVYEIVTHRGRKTYVTAEHPFYTMTDGRRYQDMTYEYEWRCADALKPKDRVATALGWAKGAKTPNDTIGTLEAWALGAWAGDGDCTHFRFINPDAPVVEKLSVFMESIGSSIESVYSTRQKLEGKTEYQEPIEHLIKGVGKRKKCAGREWVRLNYGQESKAHTKRIPQAVWTGGKEVWAAFLAGYMDTDGCVSGGNAFICSVSDQMRSELQILFARLGINASNVSERKVTVASRPQLQKLWSLLSPYMVHAEKRARLEKIANEKIPCIRNDFVVDKIEKVTYVGDKPTYSFEMKRYHTHSTDGLITHNTKHGLNVSACIFDELHTQPTRALYDVMTQGSGDARKQPLWFFLTTAGTDRNSICFTVHQKALDILEGRKKDDSFLPVIYSLPDDADWHDEKNWYIANPSLGITVGIDKVRIAYNKALESPADENQFRQLRLNQWVKQSVRWMQMDKWDECATPVDAKALEGRECYGGLDLSSTSDLTAFVLVFPPRDDEEPYYVMPFFWIPEEQMDLRTRRDHVMYDVWEKQGFMNATDGNVVHYSFIEQFICNLGEKYNIREIAHDRWNATMMVQALESDGFNMIPFGQGFKDMSPPTKDLMRFVLDKKIAHGGHPVLRWCMDNAYVKTDAAGNIKMDKEKSTEKIDGAVAMVMALDRATKRESACDSVYDERGIFFM